MLNYEAITRQIPSDNNFDVIVCGASPAGLAAAVASARTGARTLLFEAGGRLSYTPVRCEAGDGLYAESVRCAAEAAQTAYAIEDKALLRGRFLPVEAMALAAFQMLERVGCGYRLYSPVTRLLRSGERIGGVAVSTKMGERVFHARTFIDATGSGEIARHAGCPAHPRGEMERSTLGFVLMNVDCTAFYRYLGGHRHALDALLAEADAQIDPGSFRFEPTLPLDAVYVRGAWRQSSASGDEYEQARRMTRARRENLRRAIELTRILREGGVPGMESAALMRTDESLGMRAHFRIESRWARAGEEKISDERAVVCLTDGLGGIRVPYEAFLPLGAQNLLLASAALCAPDALAARMDAAQSAMEMGTVAGVAAALSGNNTPLQDIPLDALRAALARVGADWG